MRRPWTVFGYLGLAVSLVLALWTWDIRSDAYSGPPAATFITTILLALGVWSASKVAWRLAIVWAAIALMFFVFLIPRASTPFLVLVPVVYQVACLGLLLARSTKRWIHA
jgi:hypothetical protein